MEMLFAFLATVIVIAAFFYFQKRSSSSKNSACIERPTSSPKAIQFDSNPDFPVPFGYKCQWFAIKTVDVQAVLHTMQLKNVQVSNWRTGIEGAYEGYYFVSPPIHGWILVINAIMSDFSREESPIPLTVINKFSSTFGEAYYFGTHRVVEYHAWAKSMNGEFVRAYGYLGETGETIINQGEVSEEELEYDLIFTDMEADEPKSPNEEDVLFLAKKWTIDPRMENDKYQRGTGFIGTSK